jgi:His/Glu/Gln/Arg/opine family amino acid ABC transporter permease subunit
MNIIDYAPMLFSGILMTLSAWLLSATISVTIGFLLGALSANAITSKFLSRMIRLFTFIAKGIPAYVQILIAYFVLPSLFSINIPGFLAATVALGFCSSGYVTEIVRSAINSIARGQWDAAFVLGYSKQVTLRRIIVPQLFRIAFPALIGEMEQLIKSTSLLATIGVAELTRAGMNIISRELNPIPIYLLIAVVYLTFSALMNGILLIIEKGTDAHR